MRQLKGEVGFISRADGSVLFEMGNTRVITAIYRPREVHEFLASEGKNCVYDALELRDNRSDYLGKGVSKVVDNVNSIIARALIGKDPTTQTELDNFMVQQLDGTKNEWGWCKQKEFIILPTGAASFKEAMKMGVEVYHNLKSVIKKKYGQDATNVGDEGGFAPNIQENKEGLELLKTAIEKAGYTGKNNDGSQKISGDSLKNVYKSVVSEYPIVSIEDPFDKDDWVHYAKMTEECVEQVQNVGDDLLVTNPTDEADEMLSRGYNDQIYDVYSYLSQNVRSDFELMATFVRVKFTEFCQPDTTMPFGKELVQITKDLRISLPTIIGKLTSSYPEDSRYRTEVHNSERTFQPRTEPMDFKFIAPKWILGRDMAIHCALGHLGETQRDSGVSRDQGRRKIKQLSLRELELEDAAREAHYEHELEVKDFLERIEKLKTRVAYLEEELDMGENLHPKGDVAPLISNDEDYEESSTEGPVTMPF
ncbi:Enolase 2 [Hordeum vulgare]|nr:Enolase 2 [Hordeum vulgare]